MWPLQRKGKTVMMHTFYSSLPPLRRFQLFPFSFIFFFLVSHLKMKHFSKKKKRALFGRNAVLTLHVQDRHLHHSIEAEKLYSLTFFCLFFFFFRGKRGKKYTSSSPFLSVSHQLKHTHTHRRKKKKETGVYKIEQKKKKE